jgi:hypothetical protein
MRQKEFLTRIVALGLLLIMVGKVEALPYSFNVDSFQVTGNLPGNVTDEFNNGVLDPWSIQEGTAVESGGVLTLSNPGAVENFTQAGLDITTERSAIEVSTAFGPFAVAEGAGDFTVQSTWLPTLPDLNTGFGMTFHYPSTGVDQVRIGLDYTDGQLSSLYGAPADTASGLYLSFLQISPEPGTGLHNLTFTSQAIPVSAADITGDIVFQLLYNDAANEFSAAYSLDGGNTFHQPFNPFAIQSLTGSIEPFVELEAESRTITQAVPESPAPLLLTAGLLALVSIRKKRMN